MRNLIFLTSSVLSSEIFSNPNCPDLDLFEKCEKNCLSDYSDCVVKCSNNDCISECARYVSAITYES